MKSLAFPKADYLEKSYQNGLKSTPKPKKSGKPKILVKNIQTLNGIKKLLGQDLNLIGYWKDEKIYENGLKVLTIKL